MAGRRPVRLAPLLPGQGPAGRAVVVHVRRLLRVRLAQGRVLHRRLRSRRQQGREVHEENRLHGSGARKGERNNVSAGAHTFFRGVGQRDPVSAVGLRLGIYYVLYVHKLHILGLEGSGGV